MNKEDLYSLCRNRGAIGLYYTEAPGGVIDWYQFIYAWQGVEPMVTVPLDEPIPESIPEPVYEMIPAPDEVCSESLPFENIPEALRTQERWCVWKRLKDGRKIPYTVLDGGFWSLAKRCKSDMPSEWSTYDAALHCFLKSQGKLGGLSFALGDGWCGFDFDDVLVDGTPHPQVRSWLSSLGGYQEVSQSGKGIKVILRGTLRDDFLGTAHTGRQFKDIPAKAMATEVYHCGRFFFLTGEGHGETNENQQAIDAITSELLARKEAMAPKPKRRRTQPISSDVSLSDNAVLAKIRSSRQGTKFDELWNGQITAYASASEADMALTGILMFWCQNDTAQVERLFSQSGLAKRDKWDREDYRVRTLAKAHQSETYTPRVPKGYADAVQRAKAVHHG